MCPQLVHTMLSLDMEKVSKAHIFPSQIVVHFRAKSKQAHTKNVELTTRKKQQWEWLLYCAYNTFCTCGQFMTITTYRLHNLWYIFALIPFSLYGAVAALLCNKHSSFFVGVCLCQILRGFLMLLVLSMFVATVVVALVKWQFSTITFYEYCL